MQLILFDLLNLYLVVLIAAIVLSWFPIQPGTVMASVQRVLFQLTNPVLAPIRRLMPDIRLGGMSLDLSPLVVIIVIEILLRLLAG